MKMHVIRGRRARQDPKFTKSTKSTTVHLRAASPVAGLPMFGTPTLPQQPAALPEVKPQEGPPKPPR